MAFFSRGMKKVTDKKVDQIDPSTLKSGIHGSIMELSALIDNMGNLVHDLNRMGLFSMAKEINKVNSAAIKAAEKIQSIGQRKSSAFIPTED